MHAGRVFDSGPCAPHIAHPPGLRGPDVRFVHPSAVPGRRRPARRVCRIGGSRFLGILIVLNAPSRVVFDDDRHDRADRDALVCASI
jgi:hypothetical protein